jgi:hypothetical protein
VIEDATWYFKKVMRPDRDDHSEMRSPFCQQVRLSSWDISEIHLNMQPSCCSTASVPAIHMVNYYFPWVAALVG